MCSQRTHLKRRNPSLALPHGQLAGDQDTALLEAGWAPCSLTPACAWAEGCGQRQPGDSGTSGWPSSSFPPSCKRHGSDSQALILMELGNRAHGSSSGTPRCVLGCSPSQPHHTCARGNCFYFSTPRLGAGFVPSGTMFWGARSFPWLPLPGLARRGCEEPAALGTEGPRPPGRDPAAGAAQAERVCLGRRRERAAGRPPGRDVSSLLVRRGIQENNRQRWGLSRSGGAGQRGPAWGPATSHLRSGAGGRAVFRGLFWDKKALTAVVQWVYSPCMKQAAGCPRCQLCRGNPIEHKLVRIEMLKLPAVCITWGTAAINVITRKLGKSLLVQIQP